MNISLCFFQTTKNKIENEETCKCICDEWIKRGLQSKISTKNKRMVSCLVLKLEANGIVLEMRVTRKWKWEYCGFLARTQPPIIHIIPRSDKSRKRGFWLSIEVRRLRKRSSMLDMEVVIARGLHCQNLYDSTWVHQKGF